MSGAAIFVLVGLALLCIAIANLDNALEQWRRGR